jgi:hypothetical protein
MHPFQPLEKIMAKKKTGKADTSIRVIKDGGVGQLVEKHLSIIDAAS